MIRRLLAVLGPGQRRAVRVAMTLDVVAAVLQGVVFALVLPLLRALSRPDRDGLGPVLVALAVVTLAWALVSYHGLRRGMESAGRVSDGLRRDIGGHVATIPLGWFTESRLGEVGAMVTGTVMAVGGAVAHLVRPLIIGFVTPATVVLVMYALNWRLALAITLCAPVIALVYRWSGGLAGRADAGRHAATAETVNRIVEFCRAQRVIRAFGSGARSRSLDRSLAASREVSRGTLWAMLPGMVGLSITVQLTFTVVIAYGTYLVLGGDLAAVDLLALLLLAARFAEPLAEAAALGGILMGTRNAVGEIERVLAVRPLPRPAAPVSPERTDIEFEDVSFGYGDGRRVLDGVSLRVGQRTMTALVGPSGSGKTTVTRLIPRFFDVDSGAVRIGGVDVREMTDEDIMSRVTTVFQEVVLFSGSIRDNIRFGRPDASDDDVERAARAARVDEIVARLPRGWDTEVGEGGTSLSGGERQRVSIARALLKDAPIVLLDEPTAALDTGNERALHEALDSLTAGRTVLLIAHRMETVRGADQILVLADGGIAERGTHSELLDRRGRYAAFWADRAESADWRLTERSPSRSATG